MTVANQTILHIEDDPCLARLVNIAFRSFGFTGELASAGSVREAKKLLLDREKSHSPFSLIITDMKLPDGTGLDVIHEVKTNPGWKLTPIIVLSGETEEGTVGSAYALGANCYMPKLPNSREPLEGLRNLYKCWMESARLPHNVSVNRIQTALVRAVDIRTRISNLYLTLADAFRNDPEEMDFWLTSALSEGNFINLMAFFRNKFAEIEMNPATLDSLEIMQEHIRKVLTSVEERLRSNPVPQPSIACQWCLELANAMDEAVFAEALGFLFPVSPAATEALKARAAVQLQALAEHAQGVDQGGELGQEARRVSAWAQRLMAKSSA
jgi:DNA-binding response OmpR family regulator